MKFVPVGRIVSAHGVRGEVKFRYYNETDPHSLRYRSFFVDQDDKKIELELLHGRPQGALLILKFKGLDRIEDIGFLLKQELLVREDQLAPLDEGEYYDYQILRLQVVTEKGVVLGTVREIMHTRANDILVVEGPREMLVPLTEEHVVKIDIERGSITIREEAFAG